jgi:hypothetical protein
VIFFFFLSEAKIIEKEKISIFKRKRGERYFRFEKREGESTDYFFTE